MTSGMISNQIESSRFLFFFISVGLPVYLANNLAIFDPRDYLKNSKIIVCTSATVAMAERMDAETSAPPPPSARSTAPEPDLTLTIHHHSKPQTYTFPADATLADLLSQLSASLSLPLHHLKLLALPSPGLLKPPFPDPSPPLNGLLHAKKITLLAPTASDLAAIAPPPARPPPPVKPAQPRRTTPNPYTTLGSAAAGDEQYSFATLVPLQTRPDPRRARDVLARLAADAGIRAAMRRHRFAVGALAEMDPIANLQRESRTLGLNRNRGEAIELVLRTDRYDGFRAYRGVRKVLCHELAHCVFGEHDARFWKLCREIEGEVERGDWKKGGRRVGEEEYWEPPDEEVDGGGWAGGEFVLGGGTLGSAEGRAAAPQGLSRREAMAAAAEARMKQQDQAK